MTEQEKEYLESLPYDAMGDYSFVKNNFFETNSDIYIMAANNEE